VATNVGVAAGVVVGGGGPGVAGGVVTGAAADSPTVNRNVPVIVSPSAATTLQVTRVGPAGNGRTAWVAVRSTTSTGPV
jgi:hypothetical protein